MSKVDNSITVLIPTSLTPSCPSTFLIDQAVRTVRHHLPESQIIISCDGLKDGVDRKTMTQYAGYCAELMGRYDNAKVIVHGHHVHQTGMMKLWLGMVTTPVVLYFEHDFEFLPDPVEWDALVDLIERGEFNYIKFSGMHRVPPEHEHLMHERVRYGPGDHRDTCLIETNQFSTWPHLARTEWYRNMYDAFMINKVAMIEHLLYVPMEQLPRRQTRLGIYNPTQHAMMRVQHWDGARWKP